MTKEEAQKRLDEIRDEIDRLEDEADKLELFINQIESAEINRRFLESIDQMSKENTMRAYLYKDTATTPLMDDFYKSGKTFLNFVRLFYVFFKPPLHQLEKASLIVRKGMTGISYLNDGLTMTDLKKSSDSISHNYFNNARFSSLLSELRKAAAKVSDYGQKVAFEQPVRLGGQIYANQTGFGSEYNGEDLVYEGTLYGETTSFYIIGIVVEK